VEVGGLDACGITEIESVAWNLSAEELLERALANGDGRLAGNGALVVRTGRCTDRRPKDRFNVDEPSSRDEIDWGPVNAAMPEQTFARLHRKVLEYYRGKHLYARDCYAGADARGRVRIRVVTERAWHNLFASLLFIQPPPDALKDFVPEFTILNAPWCFADPNHEGTNSEVFIVINLAKGLVLIGGTQHAGEIKKSVFTIMNYVLPKRDILSMQCSANVGKKGDVALFFGLRGTGKTTLSADPERRLIGDDEHGWSDRGVFNLEGGCYAKCHRLCAECEPQIHGAIREGAVLENVVVDDDGRIDFDSDAFTENSRAAYPLSFIDNAVVSGVADHPRNIVFLTCDAFGVLPPVSRLSPEQAMYHFMSGYTAKVSGADLDIIEPQPTFSACFAAPFLPLAPSTYATMLGKRLTRHDVTCWLVNTGWCGGGFGVGERMNIHRTRAIVKAALSGTIGEAGFNPDPLFGFEVPRACPNVPAEILTPRNAWDDPDKFDRTARELAGLFVENFARFRKAPESIRSAAPRI
jgi:phosphoenolpyruvate carboxykinase (ATP)